MNILLINPPAAENKRLIREGRCTQEASFWATLWPPLTLVTIAALLEREGHEARVIDCAASGMDARHLLSEAMSLGPSLVIFSTATASIEYDLLLAVEVKKMCGGNVVVAALGTHVSIMAEECLAQGPGLDCIMRNEPEMTCLDLARAIASKGHFDGILGLSFRDSSGEIIHNPDRPFIEDLDSLPIPAWHLIDINLYRLPLKGKPFVMVNPVRGCPYNCTFCTSRIYYGAKLRSRSLGSVLKEILHVKDRFGINDIFFWSDTYTLDKAYVKEMCRRMIKTKLDISWIANSRVDTIDPEALKLMKEAGCWMISLGIESGSQRILDEAKKGIRIEQTVDAVRMAHDANLLVTGHFIFGLPGETEETIRETIRFMNRLRLDLIQLYSAVPFPGTELYNMAVKGGWIEGAAWSDFRQDNVLMNLPTIRAEEVDRWIKKAVRTFYLKPRSIVRLMAIMKAVNKPYALRSALAFAKRFL